MTNEAGLEFDNVKPKDNAYMRGFVDGNRAAWGDNLVCMTKLEYLALKEKGNKNVQEVVPTEGSQSEG